MNLGRPRRTVRVKHEALFRRLAIIDREPTDLGRRQFFDHQSSGKRPSNPDPYYTCLANGHWQFKSLREAWEAAYGTVDWPGWFQIERDFLNDTQLFNMLFNWHPNPPHMSPGAQSIFPTERVA